MLKLFFLDLINFIFVVFMTNFNSFISEYAFLLRNNRTLSSEIGHLDLFLFLFNSVFA